jgi:sulfatase modifying factor 1
LVTRGLRRASQQAHLVNFFTERVFFPCEGDFGFSSRSDLVMAFRLSNFRLRFVATSFASVALVWSAGVVGCSRPEPISVSPQAHAPSVVRTSKAGFARREGRSARRGRVQELQLLPSPAGNLLDDEFDPDRPEANNGLCPPDMASIDDQYCIDRFEASLVEILPNGDERGWSPYDVLDRSQGRTPVVRAISAGGVTPQGYVSEVQAKTACARSGKRLCKAREWTRACSGPAKTAYPYGSRNEPGRCNDDGRSPMATIFGLGGGSRPSLWTPHMNDPQLNRLAGTIAKTGSHAGCTNEYGVYDMVGNVHEWVDDPDGTFLGGFYLDTHQLGDGCGYRTPGHDIYYHDYSTGFRCCADVAP